MKFVTNLINKFLLYLKYVSEKVRKSVKILTSYRQVSKSSFFESQCSMLFTAHIAIDT